MTYHPSPMQRKRAAGASEVLDNVHCPPGAPVWRGTLSTSDPHSLRPFHHLCSPDLQRRQGSPLHFLLMATCPAPQGRKQVQISYLEISRGMGCRNLPRSMITKREAFESARPAPQHQLIINLVFPVMRMHVYFTKSHFKIVIPPLPYTTP